MEPRSVTPEEHLRRLLSDHGLTGATLRPARSQGQEHHLFHVTLASGEVRMAKVPRADYLDPHWPDRSPYDRLLIEGEAIALLQARCGDALGIPIPFEFLDGDPPGALMGVVPGQPPEQTLMRSGMDLRMLGAICHEMGATLAEIHRVRRPDLVGFIPDLPGVECDDPRLLHMDFHLGNVLGTFQLGFGWQLTGVLDWTCAHWGPREADLGELGASLFATNPQLLDDLILGYRSRTGVRLDHDLVMHFLVEELKRRLHYDPPDDEAITNLWVARIEEWSGQR